MAVIGANVSGTQVRAHPRVSQRRRTSSHSAPHAMPPRNHGQPSPTALFAGVSPGRFLVDVDLIVPVHSERPSVLR